MWNYALIFCLIASQSWAATYYVDATGGSDSNNGTSTGTPWKTLAKATNSVLVAGDFVLLKRGETWTETFTPPASGTVGNPITLGAYGSGALPTIDAANSRAFCVEVDAATNWVWDSLHFTRANTSGIFIGTHGHVVANCFGDFCYTPVSTGGDSTLTVTNCVLIGGTNEAIGLHVNTAVTVVDCVLTNNDQGINDSVTLGTLNVSRTYFSNIHDELLTSDALTVTATACKFVPQSTLSHCVWLNAGDFLNYCIIDLTAVPGSTSAIIHNQSAGALRVANCTIYGGTGAAAGQVVYNTGCTTSFTNCIFENFWKLGADGGGTLITDHCLIHNLTTKAITTEVSSITSAPLLVNPSVGDFRPLATSPVIDAGVSVGLTSDYAGTPISGNPDLGAFEFISSAVINNAVLRNCVLR